MKPEVAACLAHCRKQGGAMLAAGLRAVQGMGVGAPTTNLGEKASSPRKEAARHSGLDGCLYALG